MSQDVLGQPSLEQQVLDLHSRHEPVLVRVSLLEQSLVPESVPGIDHPGHSLYIADSSSRLKHHLISMQSRGELRKNVKQKQNLTLMLFILLTVSLRLLLLV